MSFNRVVCLRGPQIAEKVLQCIAEQEDALRDSIQVLISRKKEMCILVPAISGDVMMKLEKCLRVCDPQLSIRSFRVGVDYSKVLS